MCQLEEKEEEEDARPACCLSLLLQRRNHAKRALRPLQTVKNPAQRIPINVCVCLLAHVASTALPERRQSLRKCGSKATILDPVTERHGSWSSQRMCVSLCVCCTSQRPTAAGRCTDFSKYIHVVADCVFYPCPLL